LKSNLLFAFFLI